MRYGRVNDFLKVLLRFYLLVHDAMFYISKVNYLGVYILESYALSFNREYWSLNDVKIIGKVNMTFRNILSKREIARLIFILNIQNLVFL